MLDDIERYVRLNVIIPTQIVFLSGIVNCGK